MNLIQAIREPESISELDLSSLKVTSLPGQLWQITTLTKLGLSYNNITELPAEIGQLTNLEFLDLSSNYNLTDEAKEEIKQLLPNCEIYF